MLRNLTMTESEILAKIIEIIEPQEELTLETSIVDSDILDSLDLFNIVVSFKQEGWEITLQDTLKCNTVGELVTLLLRKQN